MSRREIVAVGASAGGVPALREFAASLDSSIPAAILVVLHIWPQAESRLPHILENSGPLPARHPVNGEPIVPGRIYVAPPDFHMEVNGHVIRLTKGPAENRHRPSIDVLFRSVARDYGGRSVGILLSGADDDGAAGLGAIRGSGGVAIAQDPDEAMFPEMPSSALRYGVVDHKLKIGEMSHRLRDLTSGESVLEEAAIAGNGVAAAPFTPAYSCPDCGGGMVELMDHGMLRFQCRVGHVLSPQSMLAAESDYVERALWGAVRALEDSAAVLQRIAAQPEVARLSRETYLQRAAEKETHARTIRTILEAKN